MLGLGDPAVGQCLELAFEVEDATDGLGVIALVGELCRGGEVLDVRREYRRWLPDGRALAREMAAPSRLQGLAVDTEEVTDHGDGVQRFVGVIETISPLAARSGGGSRPEPPPLAMRRVMWTRR